MEFTREFMRKLEILTQSLQVLKELSTDLQKQIMQAQEGVTEKSANLILGSLAGIDQTASHIKHIYEAMLFINQKNR